MTDRHAYRKIDIHTYRHTYSNGAEIQDDRQAVRHTYKKAGGHT